MAVVERRKRLYLNIQGEGAGSKEKSTQKTDLCSGIINMSRDTNYYSCNYYITSGYPIN